MAKMPSDHLKIMMTEKGSLDFSLEDNVMLSPRYEGYHQPTEVPYVRFTGDQQLQNPVSWSQPGRKADILPGHEVTTTPTTGQQTHLAHFQSRQRSPQPQVNAGLCRELAKKGGRTATPLVVTNGLRSGKSRC